MEQYQEVKKKMEDFATENWEGVFEVWLLCLKDLREMLREAFPRDERETPHSLIYQTGFNSGRHLCDWIFDYFDLQDKDVKERTLYTDAFFSKSGVGEIDFRSEGEKTILRFKGGTYFAKRGEETGEKVCQYVAGFIAGATERMVEGEYEVEEIRCVSAGDSHCDFWVKPKEK